MPKRSRIKEETKESQALKKMRISKGLSQRQDAKKIGVTATAINHTENGRANITRNYVTQFIAGLEYSWADWNNFTEGRGAQIDLKDSCKSIIDALENSKLQIIYNLLVNFS